MALHGAIKPEQRELLKSTGLFPEYVKIRDQYRKTNTTYHAEKKALQEVMPLAEAIADTEGNEAPAAEKVSNGGSKDKAKADTTNASAGKLTIPESVIKKSADVIEIIEWVAKNLAVNPTQEMYDSAPSSVAIGMLMNYKKRKADFWDKVYVKLIPNKAQLNHSGSVEFDGKEVIDQIDKIVEEMEKKREDSYA